MFVMIKKKIRMTINKLVEYLNKNLAIFIVF
jgi:hypothetical protein